MTERGSKTGREKRKDRESSEFRKGGGERKTTRLSGKTSIKTHRVSMRGPTRQEIQTHSNKQTKQHTTQTC